jgi:hypothetical protein
MVGLCALKVTSPELYAKAKSGAQVFHDIRGPLGFAINPERRERSTVEYMIKAWRFYADPSVADDNPDYRGFEEARSSNLDRGDVVSYVARNIVDRLSEREN